MSRTAHAQMHKVGGQDQLDQIDYYDRGSISLPTATYLVQYDQLRVSGTNRVTLAGVSTIFLTDFGVVPTVYAGTPKTPTVSFTVPTGYFLDQIIRLSLMGQMRVTLQGTANLILTDDFNLRSRIVLAGRGF